jgi:hypothetical protein
VETPVHFLVAPVKHIPTPAEITDKDRNGLTVAAWAAWNPPYVSATQ